MTLGRDPSEPVPANKITPGVGSFFETEFELEFESKFV
jgi:hypothetical protein